MWKYNRESSSWMNRELTRIMFKQCSITLIHIFNIWVSPVNILGIDVIWFHHFDIFYLYEFCSISLALEVNYDGRVSKYFWERLKSSKRIVILDSMCLLTWDLLWYSGSECIKKNNLNLLFLFFHLYGIRQRKAPVLREEDVVDFLYLIQDVCHFNKKLRSAWEVSRMIPKLN